MQFKGAVGRPLGEPSENACIFWLCQKCKCVTFGKSNKRVIYCTYINRKGGDTMPTVTIAKGRGYARHNDRTLSSRSKEKSWDLNLSNRNIVYVNDKLEDVYETYFGWSLEQYNQKQIENNRPNRVIKNYLEHIKRSKQEKTVYEFIVQIGDIEDKNSPNYEKIQKCLDEYNRSFQIRNLNFVVVQQITHRDEKGMDHTHIMFVPVSTGNKRGLQIKNSFSGALKQMGYGRNGFDKWRESELDKLKQIMKEHDLEFEVGDGRTEHLNVKQYREYKKYESMTKEVQNTLSEAHKNVLSAENEINTLKLAENDLDAQIAQKRTQIANLEKEKVQLEKNPKKEISENTHIQSLVKEFNDTYKAHKEMDYAEFRNNYVDSHDDKALADWLDDSEVTIKKPILGGEPIVQMPLSTWEKVKKKQNKLIDAINDLRKQFYLGVEKLNTLFKHAINEPEWLNAFEMQKRIDSLKKEKNEMYTENQGLKKTCNSRLQEISKLQKKLYSVNEQEQSALHFLDDIYSIVGSDRQTIEIFKDTLSDREDYDIHKVLDYLDARAEENLETKKEKSHNWDIER